VCIRKGEIGCRSCTAVRSLGCPPCSSVRFLHSAMPLQSIHLFFNHSKYSTFPSADIIHQKLTSLHPRPLNSNSSMCQAFQTNLWDTTVHPWAQSFMLPFRDFNVLMHVLRNAIHIILVLPSPRRPQAVTSSARCGSAYLVCGVGAASGLFLLQSLTNPAITSITYELIIDAYQQAVDIS